MPQVTLMQLSDLHKKIPTFVSTNALVSSIKSDITRHQSDEMLIARPDIHVVIFSLLQQLSQKTVYSSLFLTS